MRNVEYLVENVCLHSPQTCARMNSMSIKNTDLAPMQMVYTQKEVAAVLRYSLATVQNLMRSGKMPYIKEGQLTRITHKQLEMYLKARELERGYIT